MQKKFFDTKKFTEELNHLMELETEMISQFGYDTYQFPNYTYNSSSTSGLPMEMIYTSFPSYRIITTDNTNPHFYFDPSLLEPLEESPPSLYDISLENENAQLRQELDDVKELLALAMQKDELTERQLFVLRHMKRMEENKGWTLAFLSPSVLELIEKHSIGEYLEGDVSFYFDTKEE